MNRTLFVYSVFIKILLIRLRSNNKLKGIKIDNVELKFSQYADDAAAFLDESETSFEETLQNLDTFEKYKD